MLKYSLAEIAALLPFYLKYDILLIDGAITQRFGDLDWHDMRSMLTLPWWNEKTQIWNMSTSEDGNIIIHLEKIEQ